MTETTDSAQVGSDRTAWWFTAWDVVLLAVLSLVAAKWHSSHSADFFGVTIPPAAIWFGSIGGVIASLQGIFWHGKNWDHDYDRWHLVSPGVGAVYGLVSYLFLLVIVKSVNSSDTTTVPPVYALGAFAIGYGQQEFSSMMKAVFAVLFRAPERKSDSSDAGTPTDHRTP